MLPLSKSPLLVRICSCKVDAFACGEPEALRALPRAKVAAAFDAAASSGRVAAMRELLDRGVRVRLDFAAMMAASHGHVDALRFLRERGANLKSPLIVLTQSHELPFDTISPLIHFTAYLRAHGDCRLLAPLNTGMWV